MIGQEGTKGIIDRITIVDFLRKPIILIGDKGQGKKTLIEYYKTNLEATLSEDVIKIVVGTGVDDIRAVIDLALTQSKPILIAIPDLDTANIAAKNALLKIIEEPPLNMYFIMTVSDESGLIDTLCSRSYLIWLDKYTETEIEKMLENEGNKNLYRLQDIFRNYGDIKRAAECDCNYLIQTADKLFEHIATLSEGNLLKINTFMEHTKDAPNPIPTVLFMRYVRYLFSGLLFEKPALVNNAIACITFFSGWYERPGANKAVVFQQWLLTLQEVVRG
jgi:DNA polymerase III, gamma/tau subunits